MKGQPKTKDPHYSPIKFILEAKKGLNSTLHGQFVPFSQERDGLGRLIRKDNLSSQPISPLFSNPELRKSLDGKLPKSITPTTCISESQRVDLIEDQISRSFEYKNPKEVKLFEGNKIKIKKCKISVSER